MESLPTPSYGTGNTKEKDFKFCSFGIAEPDLNSPVHLWNTRSTVLQINIPDPKELGSNEQPFLLAP
jgi:hypothetical protein